MKTSKLSMIVLAIAVLALCAAPWAMAQSAGAPALAPSTSDAGGVRVVVTPKAVTAGAGWEFQVMMDTHTKPLDDDLTKTAVLVDDGGRRYLPLSWQGDPPGGHHRKGVLQFAPPKEPIQSLELQIEGLGGPDKRVFRWNMK